MRLDRARQLCGRRALPTMADVVYAVGFRNPSCFTRMYRKRFGKKPSDYQPRRRGTSRMAARVPG